MATDLVTTTEFKSYAGISVTTYDTLIGELIDYVTAAIESYCGRTWTSGTVVDYLDGGNRFLIASTPPVTVIASIVDTFNDDEVIDADDYTFEPATGLIYESSDATSLLIEEDATVLWGQGKRRYKVTYTGGTNLATNDIKQAALIAINDLFLHRDQSLNSERIGDYNYARGGGTYDNDGIPASAKALLAKYRLIAL